MKPLMLLLALFLPVSAQTNKLGITFEYDKFTDTTAIRDSQSIMPMRPGFVLLGTVALVKGKYTAGSIPKEIALIIESHSDQWVFLNQPLTFRVLYNGSERYSLGTMSRVRGEVLESGGVLEVLDLEVTLEAVEKLTKADNLEIQIGPLESEVKPEQLKSFKDWLYLFRKP